MTNDIERVTQIAEEILGDGSKRLSGELTQFHFSKPELLVFEQAVLSKRDEEHDSLVGQLELEIESHQANLAMQGNKLEASRLFLESIAHLVTDKVDSMPDSKVVTQAEHSITWQRKSTAMWKIINDDNEPAQADVDAFMAKKKAECLAEVYSLIEDFGGDFTLQRLKDVMNDRGV